MEPKGEPWHETYFQMMKKVFSLYYDHFPPTEPSTAPAPKQDAISLALDCSLKCCCPNPASDPSNNHSSNKFAELNNYLLKCKHCILYLQFLSDIKCSP